MARYRSVWSLVIVAGVFYAVSSDVVKLDDQYSPGLPQNLTYMEQKLGRRIFGYNKNGLMLDVRIVPQVNETTDEDDHFPMPPLKELGHCALDLSTFCFKDKISRYIDTVARLDKIFLLGSSVKFIKVRDIPKKVVSERVLDSARKIDRSIDNFFDRFALRITLPKWNRRREQNQIDFMFNDNGVEGRGKGGGGGGGGKGKGGGKCKQMMMCMMMVLKMKMVGMMMVMAVKGMMMAGISMMMTKGMLLMKLMSMKGYGGGGGGGHSGGQLKEIVLLTKAGGGGGSGGGGSSYGPPPPSSYGPPPSSGGGGYDQGGGGGWGRSLDNRLPMKTYLNAYAIPLDHQQEGTSYTDDGNWSLWNATGNFEHIGEVNEIDSNTTERKIENWRRTSDNEKLNKTYIEPKIIYSNRWKNYETSEPWGNNNPIVVTQ